MPALTTELVIRVWPGKPTVGTWLVFVFVCSLPVSLSSLAVGAPRHQQVPGPHLLHSQEDYQGQGTREDKVRTSQCTVGRGLAKPLVLLYSLARIQWCIVMIDSELESCIHGDGVHVSLSCSPSELTHPLTSFAVGVSASITLEALGY